MHGSKDSRRQWPLEVGSTWCTICSTNLRDERSEILRHFRQEHPEKVVDDELIFDVLENSNGLHGRRPNTDPVISPDDKPDSRGRGPATMEPTGENRGTRQNPPRKSKVKR